MGMTAIMVLFVMFCFVGLKFAPKDSFHEDYISPEKTASIKGVFVAIVFFCHCASYLTLDGPYDPIFQEARRGVKQLLVTLFLFYSGYGITESIRRKGMDYVKKIPVHRFLKTLLHFDIAVLLFALLNFIMGYEFNWKVFLPSLIGWSSIGNSNWYIFAILVTYIITFLSFVIFRKNHWLAAILSTALCFATIFILQPYRQPVFFNTLLCYPLGIWYSLLRRPIEKLVMRHNAVYYAALALVFMAFYWFYGRSNKGLWYYEAMSVLFAVLIVGVSMKVSLNNGLLNFLGSHVFSIYILQRLPMRLFVRYEMYVTRPCTFFFASLLITCALACAFDWAMGKLDGVLFRPRAKTLPPPTEPTPADSGTQA